MDSTWGGTMDLLATCTLSQDSPPLTPLLLCFHVLPQLPGKGVICCRTLALSSPGIFACPWGARLWGGSPVWQDGSSSYCVLGAALLDLEQTTLPGIAHLVVETMIVSDQIRPEDRASVLRTLLLKHRYEAPGTGLCLLRLSFRGRWLF